MFALSNFVSNDRKTELNFALRCSVNFPVTLTVTLSVTVEINNRRIKPGTEYLAEIVHCGL